MSATRAPLRDLDHIVWAASDLASGIAHFEALSGVRATPGGRHSSGGTENALVSLGGTAYLEIVAPVAGTDETGPWLAFCRASRTPRILTYAMRSAVPLAGLAAREKADGRSPHGPYDLSRHRPDGSLLAWKLLDVDTAPFGYAVPFFIDWLDSPHPSLSAAGGISLARFEIGYPQPEALKARLGALGVSVPVVQAQAFRFEAALRGPRGAFQLH
jgi:hypothetical protein